MLCTRTLTTEYFCIQDMRVCGATRQVRHDISALFVWSECEEILKDCIEAKVWSEKNLAKCVAVTQGDEAYP